MRRRRRQAPKPEEEAPRSSSPPPPPRRAAIIVLAGVCTMCVKRIHEACRTFGISWLVPRRFKRLGWSPGEWQEVLRRKDVVFVGGHHRSGTTLLWDLLKAHPSIAAFEGSSADFSEGAFVQDVYPTFGVGQPVRRVDNNLSQHVRDVLSEVFFLKKTVRASKPELDAGVGRYALGPDVEVHWTETRPELSAASQARVLNSFGYYWTEQKLVDDNVRILLEKSPPNAVVSRFLQALVNLGRCEAHRCWSPDPPDFGNIDGAAKFVFLNRHPIATALALRNWRECEAMSLHDLVAHWVAVSFYMRLDAPHLQHVRLVNLEHLTSHPRTVLNTLWNWLGLDPQDPRLPTNYPDVHPDPNAKYLLAYCDHHFEPAAHAALVRDWGDSVRRLGYDLDSWGAACDQADVEF